LIAHFQKAALLMFSDRLVMALDTLSIADANSVKRFKRAVRGNFENFLRFTHRYWFHDIAEQAQARALYRLCADHLQVDTLYTEVRDRVGEMNSYLDTDSLRRQANTVIRLTVVTIVGLIGTLSTGFLGMNLLAEADAPLAQRAAIFIVTVAVALGVTALCVAKSKRLSDVLDLLSDERLGWRAKLGAFWSSRGDDRS
jgi:Mg2+ and Co2+ transporter CorA